MADVPRYPEFRADLDARPLVLVPRPLTLDEARDILAKAAQRKAAKR